jgi:hypothetical protein
VPGQQRQAEGNYCIERHLGHEKLNHGLLRFHFNVGCHFGAQIPSRCRL